MQKFDFSQPMRQSSKGIIVIFGVKAFQFVKRFFVLFIAFGISLVKKHAITSLSPYVFLLIIVVALLIILAFSYLKYLNFKFYVTNDDFHLSTGILNKDNTVIPKSKIQNVYIKQNFLQQLINVVSVNIETAGDDKSEIEISALDKPRANQLKESLFKKRPSTQQSADNFNNSAESEVAENVETKDYVFFRASLKRLLLEGISQNHLKSFVIIISFFFGLFYQVKDYIKQLNLEEQIGGREFFNEEALFNVLITNFIIVVVLLFVSILFSVIKTVVINFNLEVIEHRKTIEINKGLFNKMSLTLTPSRIQNLVIKTNRLKRYLGLYRLSVKQAMVNKKQQKNFAIVALEKGQLDHLVNKLLIDYNSPSEHLKPESYYMRILWFQLGSVVVLLNIPAYFIFGSYFGLINIPLILLVWIYIYFKYKKAFYHISEEHITIGSGFVDSVTNILEIHKIQCVQLRQSFFQRRKHIASVIISTASKNVTIPFVTNSDAKSICDFLLYRVESQDRDWM